MGLREHFEIGPLRCQALLVITVWRNHGGPANCDQVACLHLLLDEPVQRTADEGHAFERESEIVASIISRGQLPFSAWIRNGSRRCKTGAASRRIG